MTSPAFVQLIDDFLANEWETSPVTASYLGLAEFDEKLDDLSANAFHKRDTDAADWLKRFEQAGENPDFEQEIDRQLAISQLKGRLIGTDWEVWK